MELGFTRDGRVLQIEAAEAATQRGPPIVGLVFDSGIVLAAKYAPVGGDPLPAFLGKNTSGLRGGKIVQLGERLAIAGVGLAGDFASAARRMRGVSFGSTQSAVDHLGDFFWQYSIRRDTRCLATMVLLGSTLDGEPHLFQFSPSGSVHEYIARAWGANTEKAQRMLADYRSGTEVQAAKLALSVLGRPKVYELIAVRA
jgi:20S proteasome alpha/beta subunit